MLTPVFKTVLPLCAKMVLQQGFDSFAHLNPCSITHPNVIARLNPSRITHPSLIAQLNPSKIAHPMVEGFRVYGLGLGNSDILGSGRSVSPSYTSGGIRYIEGNISNGVYQIL